MSSELRTKLIGILKRDHFNGDRLDAADRAYLKRWYRDYADDPIWEKVVAEARAYGSGPHRTMHSQLIYYALRVRRLAEGMKLGDDPTLRVRQARRAKHLGLAEEADHLAQYFREAEKYSGIAMFFQRFLRLPVLPEQEAVPRVEPPLLRVRQLRELHEREAELLRQQAGREPQPLIRLSRQDRGKGSKGLRQVRAFIELMTYFMKDEICGKDHPDAVALLTDIAFPGRDVDVDYVRETLRYRKRVRRLPKIRELKPKKS